MFDEELVAAIQPAPPRSTGAAGVRVALRLPWYRSLPLSCVEGLTVALDGQDVPADRLEVIVGGQACPIGHLAELHTSQWFVLDTVDVEIAPEAAPAPGAHQVAATMQLRIPYGTPERPLDFTQVAFCSRELTLIGADE